MSTATIVAQIITLFLLPAGSADLPMGLSWDTAAEDFFSASRRFVDEEGLVPGFGSDTPEVEGYDESHTVFIAEMWESEESSNENAAGDVGLRLFNGPSGPGVFMIRENLTGDQLAELGAELRSLYSGSRFTVEENYRDYLGDETWQEEWEVWMTVDAPVAFIVVYGESKDDGETYLTYVSYLNRDAYGAALLGTDEDDNLIQLYPWATDNRLLKNDIWDEYFYGPNPLRP